MGKSPGKWIKTLLFGKKPSRSHSSKGRASKGTNRKERGGEKGVSDSPLSSPVISAPIPVYTRSVAYPELEKGTPSSLMSDGKVVLPENQKIETEGSAEFGASNDLEKDREEKAAIKAQAAFRGYLARRAFHALKGIIRLQALIRGHLVRRQAVATLHCMQGVVKLQALVRGWRVRHSGISFEVKTKFYRAKAVDAKHLDSSPPCQKVKLSANTFVCKVLASSSIAKPLQIQYCLEDSNSVWNWLERWTCSQFWKPLPQPKKSIDFKSRPGGHVMDTTSGRPKRGVRRNFSANVEPQTSIASESEKHKRILRKISSHPTDPVQENPQSELEKVKRNLRKISNSVADVSNRIEDGSEKPKHNMRRVSNSQSEVSDQGIEDPAENTKKDIITLAPEMTPNLETVSMPVATDRPVEAVHEDHPPSKEEAMHEDQPVVELHQTQDEKPTVTNGELSSKEEQACHEKLKTNKRRASFSAKSEYKENGVQNTSTLPSYMAATESAKAKLRGQGSPMFGSEGSDKNDSTRRHSLPTSTHGKLTSLSPRTHRLLQTSAKGVMRSDKPLLSSRDGNEKPIPVEWRR